MSISKGRLILDLPTNELQQDDLSEKDLSDLIYNADYTVEIEDAGGHDPPIH